MYIAPLATLSELKARLSQSGSTDEAVLSEMLLGVSATIEAAAGRPLRRAHTVRERFTGGRWSIRVRHRPIARVHWIRESSVRDFDNPDNYTQLVEGEDYIVDQIDGSAPGQLGWIRRLDAQFMGNRSCPGQVEVCYTGGYKTAGEEALENSSLTIDGTTNTSLVDVFSIAKRYLSASAEGYLVRFIGSTTAKAGVEFSGAVDLVNRMFITFRPGSVLLPTWEIVEATLAIAANRSDGVSDTSIDAFIVQENVRAMLDNPQAAFELLDDPDFQILSNMLRNGASFTAETMTIHSDAAFNCGENMAELNDALRRGSLTFGFKSDDETLGTSLAASVCTETHATAGNRPSLILVHRDTLLDDWTVPHDLRHACLMQCAHDWQVRKAPGFRQETQRGVSISSGVSYTRDPNDLLPEVMRVADVYRWG